MTLRLRCAAKATLFVFFSTIGPASAQTTTSATTTAGTATAAPATQGGGSVIGSEWQAIVLFVAVGVLALAWFGITLYDRINANQWRKKQYIAFLKDLLDASKVSPLSPDEVAAFEQAARRPPSATTGLTRTLLALSLLSLVGVALVALLVGNSAAGGDTLKATITALTAALTTVLGFYFGAKTTADAHSAAASSPAVKSIATASLGPPTEVKAKAGPDPGTVVVSFVESVHPSGSSVEYTVTSAPEQHTQPGSGSPITVSGLTSGTKYSFTVDATTAAGGKAKSAASDEIEAP